MIYEYPEVDQPIKQGDIFVGLPRVEISLRKFNLLGDDETITESSWAELAAGKDSLVAALSVRPVVAIAITQDCDAVRNYDLNFCEIKIFQEVEGSIKGITSPERISKILIRQARINQKWFYLPPDERIGFSEKMGVDFSSTIRVPRKDLEELIHLRKGRLCLMAKNHFRERIAEFFRRYPFDEWYSLNREEFVAYEKEHPGSKPYPWHKPENPS